MRRPWAFLLVIAAIIAAYVWVFIWTDDKGATTADRPAEVGVPNTDPQTNPIR